MDKQQLVKRFLYTLRLILGVLLLPVVYGVTQNLLSQMFVVDKMILTYLLTGISIFLTLYLFVWEPAIIYKKGQRVLEIIFKFFAPLVKTAPYVLPIYTILISLVYFILANFIKSEYLLYYTLSCLGFCTMLHLVFTAQVLKPKQWDYAKITNYLFSFSLIFILDLWLFGYIFSFITDNFSFLSLFNGSIQTAQDIYKSIFSQLFL
jgi:hypothetical protein